MLIGIYKNEELALNADNFSECAKSDSGFNTNDSEYHENSARIVE